MDKTKEIKNYVKVLVHLQNLMTLNYMNQIVQIL